MRGGGSEAAGASGIGVVGRQMTHLRKIGAQSVKSST